MHPSASDIASFSTGRETILVGSLAAFGVQQRSMLLRERGDIRRAFDRLVFVHRQEPALRQHIRRWGLDPAAATRLGSALLPAWLTEQAMRGSLGVAVAPDPGMAFSGIVHKQEKLLARLDKLSTARQPASNQLPPDLEDRLAIVLQMVPDHLSGATRQAFVDLVDAVGIATIVGGLLLWVAAHFIPGVNIAVLAFDLFMLSGEVLRALEQLAKVIEQLRNARLRSDLDPIARSLAAVIGVLIVHGALSRLLKARRTNKAIADGDVVPAGGAAKPSAEHRQARQARQPRPQERQGDGPKPPAKKGFLPKKMGQKEPGAVDLDDATLAEIRQANHVKAGPGLAKDGFQDLSSNDRATFRGDPDPTTLPPGTKLYRVVDADSRRNGAFWSLEPPPRNEADWRSGAAVQNDWNGDGQYVEYTVPEGGLNVWKGPARAQMSSDGTSALKGGADQIVIKGLPEHAISQPQPTPWNN